MDTAAKKVISQRCTVRVGRLSLFWKDNRIFIRLPSGRNLCYIAPRLVENRFGGKSVAYLAAHANGQMMLEETFGGKLVENCTQSIARDLLAHALENLETAGYPVTFHVHDEAVIELPEGVGSVDEACDIMSRAPAWADGLPMSTAGFEAAFYRKD
jgi:DNA polymerase